MLNASGGMKEAVSIAVMNGDRILFGQREDTMLFSLPGGGVDQNETAFQAAVRELREETGLVAKDLTKLGETYLEEGVLLHCFKVDYNTDINQDSMTLDFSKDPDREFISLDWVDTRSAKFEEVKRKLQHPKNEVLKILRLL